MEGKNTQEIEYNNLISRLYSVENLTKTKWNIIVHELPFQVQKSRLIERLADLILQKKLPVLDNIRDESTEDVRIVIMPKTCFF